MVLPRGIVALEKDLPHEDVHLIAPTATLVAKSGTHPAIIELLLEAATEVHGGSGLVSRHGRRIPERGLHGGAGLAGGTSATNKSGPPFLQRYLPFWLANLIERMGVIIVPLLALLIPLSRVLPPLYTWRVRSRVYRWYGQLRDIENDVDSEKAAGAEADAAPKKGRRPQGSRRARQLARIADLEKRVDALVVPLSYANELYTLKLHIDRVRDKLVAASGAGAAAAAASTPPRAEAGLAPALS